MNIINFKLTLMNRLYPNNDEMSPEISVLIRKNSHEVIRLRVITDHYKVTAVIVNTIMKAPTK
jgi:hypothetical protein